MTAYYYFIYKKKEPCKSAVKHSYKALLFTYRKELTPFMQRKKGSILLYQTFAFLMVRMTGFEPTRISSLEPETSASANSATSAFYSFVLYFYTGRTPETVLTLRINLTFQHTSQVV